MCRRSSFEIHKIKSLPRSIYHTHTHTHHLFLQIVTAIWHCVCVCVCVCVRVQINGSLLVFASERGHVGIKQLSPLLPKTRVRE